MTARALPFGLLAITPPTGAVDVGLVARWRESAGAIPLALLLRDSVPSAALANGGRLAALAERARAAKVLVVWSVDEAALEQQLRVDAGALDTLAGVQLRGDPPPHATARARERLPAPAVLGRSIHGPDPIADPSVDFSVWAPVFAPRTHAPGRSPKAAAGLPALRRITASLTNVVALGGVEHRNAAACIGAGAVALASIQAFFGAPADVVRDVRAMAKALAERDNFGGSAGGAAH